MKTNKLFLALLVLSLCSVVCYAQPDKKLKPYVKVLKDYGKNPVDFILDKSSKYDLIIFDDALHTAVEPFEFYQKLVSNKKFSDKVKYIFLETVSVNQQPALDAYLNSKTDDLKLLYPAFQNDFSGTGWAYKTYFDLMQTVKKVNQNLPVNEQIKVIAVNAPTYWNDINTPEDLKLFRLSIAGNDYTMYRIISKYMDDFCSGKKGIFLTNTRHAYKGIKDSDNNFYLDCGTFFCLNDPGKTYSVRFHNINLYFEDIKEIDKNTPETTEGLENMVVRWVRMEKGLWDSAFAILGNRPVAIDINDTPFGKAEYIGNHMLNSASGQTMQDAYDALIFLAPVDKMHQTAMVGHMYTNNYKKELERRAKFLYTEDQIKEILAAYGFDSLRSFIDSFFSEKPEVIQPLTKQIGPIDEWKNNL